MKPLTIGVVDYGAGNLASAARAVTGLGYRCRVTKEVETLAAADAIVLPGVGAFPAAMARLHALHLFEFLREHARSGRPLIGICLGMQMLADSSVEQRLTAGLGLIPGNVRPLVEPRWHIGWNTIEVTANDPLLVGSDGTSQYFNHSFSFEAPAEYSIAVARANRPFTVVVRRGSVIGLQFHPEKSQRAGRELLRNVIEGLCRA